MRVRGSRSNARGDRRLHLLPLPRLLAQGRGWRLVIPIQPSLVAWCGSGEMLRDRWRVGSNPQYPQAPGAPKRDPQISLPTARFDLASTC